MEKLLNNAASTLAAAINSSAMSIVVANASTFLPNASGTFRILIDSEIIIISSISGSAFAVAERGAEGTTAVGHAAAASVIAVCTAGGIVQRIADAVEDVSAPAWADITGKPTFANVATSGAYGDLSGRPSLATVATSGAYGDLTGRPTLGTAAALAAGVADGVATLNSSGKIPTSQLPSIALVDTHVVASQAAMLALTAQTGDVAVRTDENKTYILKGSSASTLADWEWLRSPTDSVLTVNDVVPTSGNIVLTTSNLPEGSNQYFTAGRAQAAITGGASTIATANLTASRVMVANGSGKAAASIVTSDELNALSGLTGGTIAEQLAAKATTAALTELAIDSQFDTVATVDGSGSLELHNRLGAKRLVCADGGIQIFDGDGGAQSEVVYDSANDTMVWQAEAMTLGGFDVATTAAALTALHAIVCDGDGRLVASATTADQIGYLSTLSSNVQTQLNSKQATLSAGTGISLASNTVTNTGVTAIAGTANQITASGSTGSVTLSLPTNVVTTTQQITRLGIGTGAHASNALTVAGVTSLQNGNGIGVLLGADDTNTTLTNSTTKTIRIGLNHYTNAEEPLGVLRVSSTSGGSAIDYGGGTSVFNAATQHAFYTAANTITTAGTERLTILNTELVVNDPGGAYNFRVESDNQTHMLFVDGTNDCIGIKTSSPLTNSYLTIAAGTTTRAPLVLVSGTNLTTPQNGAFEFDGSNLYFTHSGTRRTITMS